MTVDFYAFLQAAEQRKLELGIVDFADDMEAMSNKGGNRIGLAGGTACSASFGILE